MPARDRCIRKRLHPAEVPLPGPLERCMFCAGRVSATAHICSNNSFSRMCGNASIVGGTPLLALVQPELGHHLRTQTEVGAREEISDVRLQGRRPHGGGVRWVVHLLSEVALNVKDL